MNCTDSPPGITTMNNEADTNADTCCLDSNFVVLLYTSTTVDVYPYNKSYEPIRSVPIVSGATVYHHPYIGRSCILIVNEALYYGPRLNHSLINPNQVRHNGNGFWDNPFDHTHDLSIELHEYNMVLPLEYKGTILIFNTSTPTEHELNTLPHMVLTSEAPWNPGKVVIGAMKTKHDELDSIK